MSKPICIIDGDLLAFKASAANETRGIIALHKPSGRTKSFKHRTELKETIGDKFPIEDFDITDTQSAEDISHALHTVKRMIQGICEACGTDKYEIYLSGKDNFRDELPLPQRYKGNRAGLVKPLQLKEVMEYLKGVHKAEVVIGEADDKISIRQYEGIKEDIKVIGCSTDKDSMGTDGWIYNFDKMSEPMLVKGIGELYLDEKGKVRGHGSKWKYLQWIVGDTIDGMNPCYLAKVKFGEKSGYKLLKDLETEQECWRAVHDLYKKWYPVDVEYVDQCGRNVVADYLSIAQVYWDGIHMLRWEGDFVDIRGVMNKMGVV
ncbi:hypothetical protein [Pseudomonas sp.]|uniref:hypothetical protein n=1 Tax=Pseudomonas sp. TaxID=306 RepID=UPI003FD6D285